MEKLITVINEKMFDIKKSGNPKIYIEILLLNFMSSINGDFVGKSSDIKVSQEKNSVIFNDKKNESISEKTIETSIVKEEPIVVSDEIVVDDTKDEKNDSLDDAIYLEDNDNSVSKTVGDILNLDEIINVRINNAFALANKQVLTQEMSKLSLLNDYTFDQQIGYLVCEILNSKFRVASDDIIVLSYEYDSIVQQNLEHLEQMEDVYNKLTGSVKKFAIITDNQWNELKSEYISHLKNGEHYEIKEEPEKLFKKEETNDIISNDAASIFGDIVEFD